MKGPLWAPLELHWVCTKAETDTELGTDSSILEVTSGNREGKDRVEQLRRDSNKVLLERTMANATVDCE